MNNLKKNFLSIVLLFFVIPVFARHYQEAISPKAGGGYTITLDCFEEDDNVFIRPIGYAQNKESKTFNQTSYESNTSRYMDFLALVKDKGTYCVGFMSDSINRGVGFAEMIDCRNKEEALELLYVWSVILIRNITEKVSDIHWYPQNVITEGIEQKATYYFFPKETGYNESIPIAHVTGFEVYDGIKKVSKNGGYFVYRVEGYDDPKAGVLGTGYVGNQSFIALSPDGGSINDQEGKTFVRCGERVAKLEKVKEASFL